MKIFKVRFVQHHDLKKTRGWVTVVAPDEETAIQFANKDLIWKLRGYAYHVEVKELCSVKDRPTYIDGDFFPDSSLALYNEE